MRSLRGVREEMLNKREGREGEGRGWVGGDDEGSRKARRRNEMTRRVRKWMKIWTQPFQLQDRRTSVAL